MQASFSGMAQLFIGNDAVIHTKQDIKAMVGSRIDDAHVQAIAFLGPGRNVIIGCDIQIVKKAFHDGSGADAVTVIIADNKKSFILQR